MSIRKLNEYLDVSRLDELMLNVIEPIGENGNALTLAKISESNGLPLWDDEAWPGGSVDSQAGSGTNLVVEYIVPSTCQEFTISNLDSNTWGGMIIELMINRQITGQVGIDMYINGDETYSKYSFKLVTFGTSSGSPSVYGASGAFGAAQIYTDGSTGAALGTIGGALVDVLHFGNTVGTISRQILSPTGYYQMSEGKYVDTATISNITSLKFKAYAASSIGAGTRVRIYSKKTNIASPAVQASLTNVVSSYIVNAATDTITLPNLNSVTDGGYEVELQSYNAQAGEVYCFVNGDTTLTNYYSEGLIGYQSSATVSGTQKSPVVCGADSGTYTRARINLNVDTFGYLRGDSVAFRDYSNAHISIWGFKKIATISSISSITLKHSVVGGFGVGTKVTIRKRDINIPQEQMVRLVDLTSASADYTLQVGQTAAITYTSVTSVPLRVSTVEGIYEIKIVGDRSISASSDGATFLKPNNVTVSNITRQQLYALSSSNTTYAYTGSAETAFEVGEGNVAFSKIQLSTFKKSKSITCDTQCILYTSSNKLINHLESYWADTTTDWSSLGTISFPFAQSGKIIIKRLA